MTAVYQHPTDPAAPDLRSRWGERGRDLVAWLSLAAATLAVLWPLGLTNRILAGVDAFTYFTPYWAYRMAELRAGHLPLWNPYLFLGVPFLANPQAAVLYPLHWPLSWLTPAQALIWSALLHVWLAAGFTYAYARRSFALSRPAAWLTGAIFGLGGFTLARIENINQLNALAWLPATLWLYDETVRAAGWSRRIRWGSALAVVIALQLLAGHTQTFFVNMCGLAVYAAWPAVKGWRQPLPLRLRSARPPKASLRREKHASLLLNRLLPLLTVLPALLLCAAQLLPTLELNGLGLRTGGLSYRQAASFSLRPRLLAQSLLPPFDGGLAQAFASEGYGEFLGYVGVAALILVALGIRGCRKPDAFPDAHPGSTGASGASGRGAACDAPLVLAVTGFFLALGAYNPVYYLLWRFVPGFDLFRAPARWLALAALGLAVLAGMGLDALGHDARPARTRALWRSKAGRVLAVLGAAGLVALLVLQQWPGWRTLAGWLAAALLAVALIRAARRWPGPARGGLMALALAELWLGGRALPFTQATAPFALSLRNAPAALLAQTAGQPAPGRDRFLSLSDIRYDPGDLAELRSLQADRLSPDAVERMVRAAKQVEVIAPNLPLLYQLPAVDGYDGGLLPLGRYVQLQGLFVSPDLLVPDGRLREQLRAAPADRLLDLTGVRYVITDKQRDLWADDVYYDLELPAPIAAGQALTLDLTGYPAFSATALGIVAEAESVTGAEITLAAAGGATVTAPLQIAAAAAAPQPTRVALPEPITPTSLTVRNIGSTGFTLRGLSLIDGRTAAHTSVTVSPRGNFRRIHSGDVKLYERLAAPGRAWLVHGVRPIPEDAADADQAATLAALAAPGFDPRTEVVIAAEMPYQPPAAATSAESVTVLAYEAERVVVRADLASDGLLVLADTFYPGWLATVDGAPAPILRANLLFRAVALTPGSHEVTFTYRPSNWRIGAAISLLTLLALLAIAAATRIGFSRPPPSGV